MAPAKSLQFVADVGVDSAGNIWLVDSDVSHVLKFDASGKYLSKLGMSYDSGQSNDRFNGPHSIAFDSAGNIYVSDSWNNRIQVFKSDGSYLATIGDNRRPRLRQRAISATRSTSPLSSNVSVRRRCLQSPGAAFQCGQSRWQPATWRLSACPASPAATTRTLITRWALRWTPTASTSRTRTTTASRSSIAPPGRIRRPSATAGGRTTTHLRHPADVAVDAAGNIYVADWLNAHVQQFNSSLTYVRTYGATGVPYLTDNLHYNTPSGLAVASDGSIYVTEARGQRLLKLNAGGTTQWVVGVPGVVVDTDANDRLNNPRDVALAPSGLVYVADSSNDRIQIFNPDGSYYATLGTGYGTGDYQFKWPTGLYHHRRWHDLRGRLQQPPGADLQQQPGLRGNARRDGRGRLG